MPKTIRMQIMTAFVICFAFMAAVIGAKFSGFKRLSWSMELFELSEEMNSAILEMRRYEKNYFLYRQNFNFEENLSYTNTLALTVQREKENLVSALGEENYENLAKYVQSYAELMSKLHESECDVGRCNETEAAIRGVGQNLIILADQLVTTERKSVNRLLQQMMSWPMISMVVMFVLLAFVVLFIGEKVIRPLGRITRDSEAVAQGTFQRITAYGGPGNEIHHLVSAINRMVEELEKRQEQLIQSRKIASIGTLTAGIAHEINNPVNNLSLILESLIEGGSTIDEAERSRLYEEAMSQADQTSKIVKDLLEFSRAVRPPSEQVELSEVIHKAASLIRNELDLHRVKFTTEVRGNLPKIHLDKCGMQQVMINMFVNSIQAMEGGGELTVVLEHIDGAREVRVDISDTGSGIPPEFLSQIYDPFFTTKKEGIGTGLGLSVCYSIIKKNGGRIEVESRMGQGTRFSIFLPVNDEMPAVR